MINKIYLNKSYKNHVYMLIIILLQTKRVCFIGLSRSFKNKSKDIFCSKNENKSKQKRKKIVSFLELKKIQIAVICQNVLLQATTWNHLFEETEAKRKYYFALYCFWFYQNSITILFFHYECYTFIQRHRFLASH